MRRFAIGFATYAALGGWLACAAPAAARHAVVVTDHGCYRVGQRVVVAGAGFAPQHLYDIAIENVDFGQNVTDSNGNFVTALVPGGLNRGLVQSVDTLSATDGVTEATTRFTLTRSTGARFLTSGGNVTTLRAPLQLWGFGLNGKSRPLYLHYVSPSGQARRTFFLGRTGGQCGYLKTTPRRVFPFSPSLGTWKLQIDSLPRYVRRPTGPVARIFVPVSRG